MTMPSMVLPLGSVLGDVLQLILRSGIFAKVIVLILASLSVFSWAIMVQRARIFGRAEKMNAEFWRRFDQTRDGELTMADLSRWCEGQVNASPLAAIFHYFSQEYWPMYRQRRGGSEEDRLLLGMLSRGIDRVASARLEWMERPLTWLATFSSVSPFLGLLGTVWGILGSFMQLGRQGSATLDVVGPGIAEALITTVCGLAVAIPAVVGYNAFMRRIAAHDSELTRLSSLLSDVVTEEALQGMTAKTF
jgi:biopolymer transport protein TolQ